MSSAQYVYGDDGSAVHFRTHYVDDSTGNTIDTTGKAFIIDFDEVNGVATYVVNEHIVASSEGLERSARGHAYVTLDDAGVAALLQGWNHWILH